MVVHTSEPRERLREIPPLRRPTRSRSERGKRHRPAPVGLTVFAFFFLASREFERFVFDFSRSDGASLFWRGIFFLWSRGRSWILWSCLWRRTWSLLLRNPSSSNLWIWSLSTRSLWRKNLWSRR